MATTAAAANVSFDVTLANPSAAALAAGAPDWSVFRFYVTTDADVISIDDVQVRFQPVAVPLFQAPAPLGSNVEPPDPAFVAINRALEVDSWVSTPGATSHLGADLPGDGTGAWYDVSDDGPQNDFHFATLTFDWQPIFFFTGQVTVAGAQGPEHFPFLFGGPEPSAGFLGGGGFIAVAAWVRRRRQGPC
jgi:hypothetical protein